MAFLERGGARIAYEVGGEGPALTLLHGFTQSRLMWDEVTETLGTGYRLLRPDLRGHGETEVEAGGLYTMDACLQDLEALWDHLGIARPHLAGEFADPAHVAPHALSAVHARSGSCSGNGAHP